jgi:hypothetical protein
MSESPRRTHCRYVEYSGDVRTTLEGIFSSVSCRSGGTGRRTRFRVWRPHGCPGSNPGFGTIYSRPLKARHFFRRGPEWITNGSRAGTGGNNEGPDSVVVRGGSFLFEQYQIAKAEEEAERQARAGAPGRLRRLLELAEALAGQVCPDEQTELRRVLAEARRLCDERIATAEKS